MPSERLLELIDLRHHEAQLRRCVGKLALQIEKVGAGDVACLERVPARHGRIGRLAPRRQRLEIGRAIENPQVGLAELRSKLFSRDQ